MTTRNDDKQMIGGTFEDVTHEERNRELSCGLVHPSFLGVSANGKTKRNSHSLVAWVFSTASSRHPHRNRKLVNSCKWPRAFVSNIHYTPKTETVIICGKTAIELKEHRPRIYENPQDIQEHPPRINDHPHKSTNKQLSTDTPRCSQNE